MKLRVIAEKADASEVEGFGSNIEDQAVQNDDFRKVLYTAKYSQLVLMSLKPGEDIGLETHGNDQFFRVEEGTGESVINGTRRAIEPGSAIIVPAGAKHNVTNTGDEPLKLYTLYSPPHHQDKTVHKTRKDAEQDDETFNGETTE